MISVTTGLEKLISDHLDMVKGPRIGFITNHSAITSSLTPAVDALLNAGVEIRALFSPEHGLMGEFADGKEVSSSVDARTGLPVVSLYGKHKKPTSEMLSEIDLLLFDIQDIGARFYTYLYTMAYAMHACAENGKRMIVLDRPNPIDGLAIEGPVLEERYSSFVGLYPIPIRYGLTIGELATLFNSEFGIHADLEVIPLEGWKRGMWFDETLLPWVPTSPAIPSLENATVYSGMCLLEGTNVSEGRGTDMPFVTVGAPWIRGHQLAKDLSSAGLPGTEFEPVSFVPSTSKYAGEVCQGARLLVTDRAVFQPVLTGVKITEIIRKDWPSDFEFRASDLDGRRFFDLLAGTDSVRLGLEAGESAENLSRAWADAIETFNGIRLKYFLYTP